MGSFSLTQPSSQRTTQGFVETLHSGGGDISNADVGSTQYLYLDGPFTKGAKGSELLH